MNLKEIFDQLTYGELSQLSIGGNEAGKIDCDNYDRVLPHVNLGLMALYKRFPLKEGMVKIQLAAPRTDYPIHSQYAVSNTYSGEPVKFVLDSVNAPFTDDINKIERVYAESGYEFVLNDLDNEYALVTPTATMLRVPEVIVGPPVELDDLLKTSTLKIAYRASHRLIINDEGSLDPEDEEIELPYTHLEALLLFIAARMHTPVGMTDQGNTGNLYLQKYEMACQQIEQQNLRVDQGSQSTRFQRNGWV